MTWRWLDQAAVKAMHDEQIAEHGGRLGLLDQGILASALARPRQLLAYGDPSVFDLAAAHAFGIVRDHPFVDGNKRTGLLAAYAFLYLNGWVLRASEAEAVTMVLGLATGEVDEPEVAMWLKKCSIPRDKA